MRAALAAAVLLFAAAPARAEPFGLLSAENTAQQALDNPKTEDERKTAELLRRRLDDPGYFNGLGTKWRKTELSATTTFDTNRTFTQRFELAHAFDVTTNLSVVGRLAFGGADLVTVSNAYSLQGPLGALGLRYVSPAASYFAELGFRVIPPWPGPLDGLPVRQELALDAVLSSAAADDAMWLPFARFGSQLYGSFQARTDPFESATGTFLFGVVYGGAVSLAPLTVTTWLGPQSGLVGNIYLELFADAPRLGTVHACLQLGARAEVSLSSIWPGSDPLPMLVTPFLAWAPVHWFSARVFGGLAGSPAASFSVNYGATLELYAR